MAISPQHAAPHLRDLFRREDYVGVKNDSMHSRELVEWIEDQIDSAIEELNDPIPSGRVIPLEVNRETGIASIAVLLSLEPLQRVIFDSNRSVADEIRQKYMDAGWSLTFVPHRDYVIMAMNFRPGS